MVVSAVKLEMLAALLGGLAAFGVPKRSFTTPGLMVKKQLLLLKQSEASLITCKSESEISISRVWTSSQSVPFLLPLLRVTFASLENWLFCSSKSMTVNPVEHDFMYSENESRSTPSSMSKSKVLRVGALVSFITPTAISALASVTGIREVPVLSCMVLFGATMYVLAGADPMLPDAA